MVDPVTGRAYREYPVPMQPPQPPVPPGGYRDYRGYGDYREPRERERHAPRHLADSWEGPVSMNRPLPSRRPALQWLLAIPLIPPLLVPVYNRLEPRLFGIPFFYWYQLACILLAVVIVTLVYQLTKGRRPRWPR